MPTIAPIGPAAAAPTASPVKTPMFSCFEACGCALPAAVAADAGRAARDIAATVTPTVPTRTLLLRMLICQPSSCGATLRAVEDQYEAWGGAAHDTNRAIRR